jgi:hypothetical protein
MAALHVLNLKLPTSEAAAADEAAVAPALQAAGRLLAAAEQATHAAPGSKAWSCALHIRLRGNWNLNRQAWQAIQQLPSLSPLSVRVDSGMSSNMCHLSALEPLAGTLQHFSIGLRRPADAHVQQEQAVDYSALGSLTQLTSLLLSVVPERQGLHSIGKCSKVTQLAISARLPADASSAAFMVLTPLEWSNMCQMTQLQTLNLWGLACGQHSSGWQHLSGRQQLQELDIPIMPYAALPALASLPKLRNVRCRWEQEEEQQPAVVQQFQSARCLSVQTLIVLQGTPPLWAFPGLLEL